MSVPALFQPPHFVIATDILHAITHTGSDSYSCALPERGTAVSQ